MYLETVEIKKDKTCYYVTVCTHVMTMTTNI